MKKPRSKSFTKRPSKPVETETTLALAHRQTAENLGNALVALNDARARAEAANAQFQALVSGVLTENGIETADIVKVTVKPPALVVKVSTRLKPDKKTK